MISGFHRRLALGRGPRHVRPHHPPPPLRRSGSTTPGSPLAPHCCMPVADALEASMVLENRAGVTAGHELDVLLERAEVELVAVTVERFEAPGGLGGALGTGIIRRRRTSPTALLCVCRNDGRAAAVQGRRPRPHRCGWGITKRDPLNFVGACCRRSVSEYTGGACRSQDRRAPAFRRRYGFPLRARS